MNDINMFTNVRERESDPLEAKLNDKRAPKYITHKNNKS
jgi:hypothetical protein